MTAVQYLKKKNWISRLGKQLGLIFGFIVLAVGMTFYSRSVSLVVWTVGPLFFWICVIPMITYSITIWMFWCWERYFIQQHPEMEHLDEWMFIIGSAEKYPVDESDKMHLVPEIEKRIRIAAACANLAFEIRNQIYAIGSEYHALSAERSLAKSAYHELAYIAEEENKKYLEAWNLFIDDLYILHGGPYSRGPRVYREGLLKLAQV